ncbi:dihydrolipoyl dehydrogenase [Oxalicibacterium solurbis]|uniref:Dihydrolipoyl dehydrogenase n=1 Tax=Oxalicibacterium solurbis TaxID=69280 RepID=A0A8J3B4M5_9BURK|nr:dihydrolipoyl dehydrogenase [Oxalicibacterium solurbis]GGI55013.1 dihydrolipoyl dehydrogenase [Oxalicibacterium solurbis]
MKTVNVDVAVIGAGSAGLSAFRAAKARGASALLIEGGAYGTTCARVGCMPSKLLISAADVAHAAATADAFGVQAEVRIDGRAVMRRVKSERDRFVGFVVDSIDGIAADERLRGRARFLAADTLQVGEDVQVKAARVVIATGSAPAVPDMLHGLGNRALVSDDVFDWDDLPESVAVVGAGVIGLELGQALHRLGVRVAVFGRSDRLASIADDELNQAAISCIGNELDLRLGATIVSAQPENDQVTLHSRDADGRERTEHYRYVLAATGRKPNLAGLGLENTGLQLDDRGIPRFDPLTMQCSDSTIFIAGDVDGDRPLLHEAADEGRIAGSNAARYPHVAAGLRRIPMAIAFTDPQVMAIGQIARTLKPKQYQTGHVSFANQGRSRVMLQNRGMLKVYGERGTHRFLGAEMVGPRAEHIAHLLAWACQAQMTVDDMLAMPFYHPVVEEGVRTALRDLKENLVKQVYEIEHCSDCTPGI